MKSKARAKSSAPAAKKRKKPAAKPAPGKAPGEPLSEIALTGAGASDVGLVRQRNEDAYVCGDPPGVFLVADGMGGHAGGDVASRAIAAVLPSMLTERLAESGAKTPAQVKAVLADALCEFSGELCRQGASRPQVRGLGSTVVALIARVGVGYLAYAGDSRAYRLRNGKLERMSEDHTVVAMLVRTRQISAKEARVHPFRHAIEEYIGKDGRLNPGVRHEKLRPGDRWLLCSDGLTNGLTEVALRRILLKHPTPEAACKELLTAGLKADGSDNITAVVVDVSK